MRAGKASTAGSEKDSSDKDSPARRVSGASGLRSSMNRHKSGGSEGELNGLHPDSPSHEVQMTGENKKKKIQPPKINKNQNEQNGLLVTAQRGVASADTQAGPCVGTGVACRARKPGGSSLALLHGPGFPWVPTRLLGLPGM